MGDSLYRNDTIGQNITKIKKGSCNGSPVLKNDKDKKDKTVR